MPRSKADPRWADTPWELSGGEVAEIERCLDRIEERIHDAADGWAATPGPASVAAVRDSGLPPGPAMLWRLCDGLDLGFGEAELLSLDAIAEETASEREEGRVREGEWVIGRRGRDLLVLPEDPYEVGGEVVLVEESGDRWPEASSLPRLVLGLFAELAVLYDEEGEFREDVVGEDMELPEEVERKLCRRRLDHDEDAPRPRYRLAQLLRRRGELAAARSELRRTLRCAPEFAWAHHELGLVLREMGEEGAAEAFGKASECMEIAEVAAHFAGWAALASSDEAQRAKFAARANGLDPGLANNMVQAARARAASEDGVGAAELLRLARAVSPGHLEAADLLRKLESA